MSIVFYFLLLHDVCALSSVQLDISGYSLLIHTNYIYIYHQFWYKLIQL